MPVNGAGVPNELPLAEDNRPEFGRRKGRLQEKRSFPISAGDKESFGGAEPGWPSFGPGARSIFFGFSHGLFNINETRDEKFSLSPHCFFRAVMLYNLFLFPEKGNSPPHVLRVSQKITSRSTD